MKKFIILGIIGITILFFAPVNAISDPAGPPTGLDVKIVGQDQPVEVTGKVDANVTGDVGVTGEVEVLNTNENPIPVAVTNRDGIGIQPKHIHYQLKIIDKALSEGAYIYTVPDKKRLTIEYVSLQVAYPDPEDSVDAYIGTEVDGVKLDHYLGVAEPQGRLAVDELASNATYISKQVRLYADPNTEIYVLANRTKRDYGTFMVVSFSISGYLSDVP